MIEVVDGGLLTTVQDLGRYGYQRYGVPVSGVMDPYSLALVNTLLGNEEGAAALEITLVGPKLVFLEDTVFALGGTDLAARLNGEPVPTWQVLRGRAGSLLSFDGPMAGVRGYLATPGGIDVPLVMGSRSTYARAGLGGLEGRALRAGDRLDLGAPDARIPPVGTRAPLSIQPSVGGEHLVRVIMGPQADAFTPEGIATFLSESYSVSQQSDRVGCRLEGPSIEHADGADIVSDGIPFGGIQVTGDGLPVVLMADRGITGGYTKIATVATVDLGQVAQALPGDTVSFKAITVEEGHRRLAERRTALEIFREQVDQAEEKAPQQPRVTVGGEAFEVSGEEGEALTQVDSVEGQKGEVRTVTATVNGRSYTFEVEVEAEAEG